MASLQPYVAKTKTLATRIKIVNPEHLEKEIKEKASAFRTMAESTKKLKDLAVERMGGTVARAEIFEEQNKPVVEALERVASGKPVSKEVASVAQRVKAAVVEGKNLPDEQITPKTTLDKLLEGQKEQTRLLGEQAQATERLRLTQTAPSTIKQFLQQTETFLGHAEPDGNKISLIADANSKTGFSLNGREVEISRDGKIKLPSGADITITPELAFLLSAKVSNKEDFKNRFKKEYARDAAAMDDLLNTYALILRESGVSLTDTGRFRGNKANAIREVIRDTYAEGDDKRTQFGLGHKKPQSGRVLGGKFGALVVDTKQLGKGIFSAKDPSGNLVFHAKVSDGVRHLLTSSATKAQAGKGKYTDKDLATYHELAAMAGVSHKPTDTRRQLKNPAVKNAVFLPEDPKAQFDRLQTLMGLHGQGNDNKDVKTEALLIADRLLKSRHLSKGQHKHIYEALV